jgi:hypothetical protein
MSLSAITSDSCSSTPSAASHCEIMVRTEFTQMTGRRRMRNCTQTTSHISSACLDDCEYKMMLAMAKDKCFLWTCPFPRAIPVESASTLRVFPQFRCSSTWHGCRIQLKQQRRLKKCKKVKKTYEKFQAVFPRN